jgi:hypothetical protein
VVHNPHSSQGNNSHIITQLMVDMEDSLVDQTISECHLCRRVEKRRIVAVSN